MATFTKERLSGCSSGKLIKVSETSSPGTVIHASVSGGTSWDEIWLYAVNNSEGAHPLIIEYGGLLDPDDLIRVSIAPQSGLVLIVPGFILQNSNVVRAFCPEPDVLCIGGWVNRITA